MTIRTTIIWLLGLALGLPALQSLLYWASQLLSSMGDQSAAHIFSRIHLAVGAAWLICLTALVIALAVRAVSESHDRAEEQE